MKRNVLITVLVGLVLALLPAAAGAATLQVNDSRDAVDADVAGDPACDTDLAQPGPQCTLRAALEQGEQTAGADNIGFSLPLAGGDTIALGAPLVVGGQISVEGCSSQPNSAQPCVGVDGSPSFDAFDVEGPESAISGLAISGAKAGIHSAQYFSELSIRNNWIGLRLDGSVEGNEIGVKLENDWAVLGGTAGASGTSPADRNVISGNAVAGVQVYGGDTDAILGNYIGVMPDGVTPAGNGIGVQVVGQESNTDPSGGAVIGGVLSDAAAATPVCDDACNVISSNLTAGIDLEGELPATEAAQEPFVRGNFVGLDVSGSLVRPNPIGIVAGYAERAYVGGAAATERNYVTGGRIGIKAMPANAPYEANYQDIRGNFVGLDSTGTKRLSPPSEYGILGKANEFMPIGVAMNRIVMNGGAAIRITGEEAFATENVIGLGVDGEDLGGGDVGMSFEETGYFEYGQELHVTDNVVTNTSGPGIELGLDTQGAHVLRNRIGVGAGNGTGGPGIVVRGSAALPSGWNEIGGADEADENRIDNSGGSAIEIAGVEQQRNRILVNEGSGNARLFVDLASPNGPGNSPAAGANAGIQQPQLLTATAAGASGKALPGATVRVYSTDAAATEAPRSLTGYLGQATADANGDWSLTYGAPIDPSTAVTASQTDSAGNSSELSTGDITPPNVEITAGPSGPTTQRTPTFEYRGDEDGDFACFIESADHGFKTAEACPTDHAANPTGAFTPSAPLADGDYAFHVTETDLAGNVSSEKTRSFSVETPVTTVPLEIVKGPDGPTRETRPTFTFTGEGGATFRCSIDSGPEVDCPGMEFTPGSPLANGTHTFSVTQYDAQGKAMSTQTRAFSIEAACKPAETPAPQPVIDPGPPSPARSSADITPPDTKIRAPKPRRFVALKKAKLRLISTEAGSSFQCKLDRRAFRSCGALTRAAKLKLKPRKRPYALRARATDAAGNADPSAAVVKFKVAVRNHKKGLIVLKARKARRKGARHRAAAFARASTRDVAAAAATCPGTPAPQPVIDPGPPSPAQSSADTTPPDTRIRAPKPRRFVALKKAKLRLISTEAGSSFQCKLDRRAFKTCGALTRAAKLKLKPRKRPYALRARATDAAGNADPSAAVVKFKVAVRNHKRVLQVQAPAKKKKKR